MQRKVRAWAWARLALERPKLPTGERIIVRVHVGGDKGAAPVDATAHGSQVALSKWREVTQPVVWVPVQEIKC